jgi:hypothetical protein
MPVEEIISLIMGLSQAIPALLNSITAAQQTNGIVPAAQVATILSQYGIDRAVLAAAIAKAQTAGK